jgi:hypothetical protein
MFTQLEQNILPVFHRSKYKLHPNILQQEKPIRQEIAVKAMNPKSGKWDVQSDESFQAVVSDCTYFSKYLYFFSKNGRFISWEQRTTGNKSPHT